MDMNTPNKPRHEVHRDKSRFYVENVEGDVYPISYVNGTLVITTFGQKVVFSKTNRSDRFRDSRDGKMLNLMEFKEEVIRLLDDPEDIKQAIGYLTGIKSKKEWEAMGW